MNLSTKGDQYFPNKIGPITLQSTEEIIGPIRINKEFRLKHFIRNYPENNLELEFSFEQMSVILSTMGVPMCCINISKI